jgi:hypothetical protein
MRIIDIDVLDGKGVINCCVNDIEAEIRLREFLNVAYESFKVDATNGFEYIKPSSNMPLFCQKHG